MNSSAITRLPLWMKVAGIVLLLLFVGWALQPADSEQRPGTSSDDGYGAEVACQDFVKDRLKSPGTADFSDEEATGPGPTWVVTGSVDSENTFGGVVRNTYSCTVVSTGADKWKLEDMESTEK